MASIVHHLVFTLVALAVACFELLRWLFAFCWTDEASESQTSVVSAPRQEPALHRAPPAYSEDADIASIPLQEASPETDEEESAVMAFMSSLGAGASTSDKATKKAQPAFNGARRSRAHSGKDSWRGQLLRHGVGRFEANGENGQKRSYSCYFVSLRLDNGRTLVKQGRLLEDAVRSANVQNGDHIQLVFYGRESVTVDECNGERTRAYRNRWEIIKLN